jgi:hypothetical protein
MPHDDGKATAAEPGNIPPRPKSRNDLDALKAARHRRGRDTRGKGKTTVDPASLKDEIDFAGWYGELEDQLENKNNDDYRYGT